MFETTLASGSSSRQWVCLTTDCYRLSIDSSDAEISWVFEDQQGWRLLGTAPTNDLVCTDNKHFNNTPTMSPTTSFIPSLLPTPSPTSIPSSRPTHIPTLAPTKAPTLPPSHNPTVLPSFNPTSNCFDGQYFSDNSCLNCQGGRYSLLASDNDTHSIPYFLYSL